MIKNFNDIPLSEKLDNQLFRIGLIKTMLSGINDTKLKFIMSDNCYIKSE